MRVFSPPSAHSDPEHFRVVAEGAPAMLWMGDRHGKCIYLNRAQRAFWGVDEAAVGDFDWNSSLHPDDVDVLLGPFTTAMTQQTSLQVEARYRRADGAYRILHTRAEPRFDAEGVFQGMIGINTDVTEQRAAERTLGIQALILQHMTEGVSLSDEDGIITYTNRAEDTLFGYEPGELVGQHVSVQNAYGPAENLDIVAAVIKELKQTGAWSGDWHNRRKDGSEFISASNITTVQVDDRPHFLCVQRDVTEERGREREQRATAMQLDLAMQAAGLGHWVWNAATDHVALSPRAAEIFARPSSTASTWSKLEEIVHPEDRDQLRATIASAMTGAGPFEAEYRIVPEGGHEIRWIAVRGTIDVDDRGSPVGLTGVVRDDTVRRDARERERLLAREVDHRAKNALAVVQSIARLTPFQDHVSYIATVTGRIDAMARVHTLLSKNSWAGATIEQILRAELAPFETEGRFRIEGPQVHLRLEAAQPLTLLVHELATNAAKYGSLSRQSGRLDITWQMTPDGNVDLVWVESGGPKISEPAQFNFGSKLIHGCAGQLGGHVRKRWDRDGLFCRVRIGALQLSFDGVAPTLPKRNGVRPVRLDGSRIFVVEDEVLLAMELVAHLEAAGASVVGPAHSLKTGLTMASSEEFDAAVLDLNLGGLSAAPLLKLLEMAGVPIVVITGYGSAEVDVPVVSKPVQHEELLEVLARRLAGD